MAYFPNPKKPAHEVILELLEQATFSETYTGHPADYWKGIFEANLCILGQMIIPEGAKASVTNRLTALKRNVPDLAPFHKMMDEMIAANDIPRW